MFERKKKPAPSAPVAPPSPAPVAVLPAAERAAEIEIELIAARTDLAQAQAELLEARGEYEAALDRAALSAAQAAKLRIGQIEITVEMAQRLVERVAAEHAAACQGANDAAALAERERLRDEAEEAMRQYEATFRARMPEVVSGAREVLRLWAKAELAREAASDAGIALPRVDGFRDVAGRPREVIRLWERDLWVNGAGDPFEGKYQDQVKLLSDGTGRIYGTTHTTTVTKKRRFSFTEYLPHIDTKIAPLLARELLIPALFANEPAGYVPPVDRYDARAVLARLDALEVPAAPPAEPVTKTDRKPIEAAREVKIVPEPRESVFTRIMSGF